MKIALAILPCYNEEKNIGALVNAWLNEADRLKQNGYELYILVVDDKSADSTKAIIEKLSGQNERVLLSAHEKNTGLGGAISTGFKYFLNEFRSGDVCFVMDGDNTHDPKYAAALLDKLEQGFDCAIASRYIQGSDVVGVPGFRNFLSLGAKLYYKILLPVPSVKDYTCGYRAYTYDILKRAFDLYGDSIITQTSFACMMEILYKLYKSGAAFSEVPFILRYDFKQGKSKLSIMKTVRNSIITAFKLRLGII